MNYLALVNRARRECGVASSPLATLSGLSTEDSRVATWVAEAWRDLQLHRSDWQWMRKEFAFNTVAADATYTPTEAGATDMADWKRDSFRAYLTATGYADEQVLPFMEWDTFRAMFGFGAQRTQQARPVVFTIKPDRSLQLGPLPDAIYTINGEYYRTLTELTLTTDDPSAVGNDLPERWHMLIVWMACRSYASYEAASEVLQRAEVETRRLLQRLEFEQLPTLTSGAPLA